MRRAAGVRGVEWALLALLVVPAVAVATPGPVMVLAEIERAWNARDADGVLAHLAPSPVHLTLARSGGVFPHQQAEFILRDLLEFDGEHALQFVAFHWDRDGNDPVEAEAHWRHGTDSWDERLEFELIRSDGAWVISRIESIERWRTED